MKLSDKHKQQRIGKITSSVAAGCLGLSPWQSPLQAWRAIRGEDDFEGNEATERGHELEPIILKRQARELQMDLVEAPFRVHPAHQWLAASADGVLVDGGRWAALCEAKSVSARMEAAWGEPETDEVPDPVLVQCLVQLACWPEIDQVVVGFFGGYDLAHKRYIVQRSDDAIARLVRRLGEWRERHLVGNVAPAAQHNDAKALQSMFPERKPLAPATDEHESAAAEYARALEAEKEARKAKDAAGCRLRQLLGESAGAESDAWKITWKTNKGGSRVLRVTERTITK